MARKKKAKVETKQTAKPLKARLSLLIIVLLGATFVLTFRLGETLWSTWMMEHRTQIIGFFLLALIISVMSIPIITEVEKEPRPLSGSDVDSKWLI